MVKQAVEAARCILAHPPEPKEHLSAELDQRFVTRLEKGSVAEITLATLYSLGYFSFLQWDELHR